MWKKKKWNNEKKVIINEGLKKWRKWRNDGKAENGNNDMKMMTKVIKWLIVTNEEERREKWK